MLLEKLTESELEFLEDIHNPICLGEILFGDFDNLSKFDNEKLDEVRLYQQSMLSYEYLLDDDPNLSEKENFKLREGCGNLYAFGARKYGKCEWEENKCLLSDGRLIKFKDLIGTKKEVLSLNQETLKIERSIASFSDNDKKKCLRIKTKTGKYITITENHPFLTDFGWVKAKDLKVGDFIATPQGYNIEGTVEVDENLAKLLGYLLGDGSCTSSSIGFTNINQELIDEYYEIADYFGCKLRKNKITYYAKKKDRIKGWRNSKNKIFQLVLQYGLHKLSINKTIPEEVFLWKNKYISILLNRYFACDAHINYHNWSIELCSMSHEMLEQVHHLLLRFNIRSYIGKNRLFIAEDFDKFLDIIGIKSKDKNKRKIKKYSTTNVIPKIFLFENNKYLGNGTIRKSNVNKQFSVSRLKLQSWLKNKKESHLNLIANSDIYWDKIKTIEGVGILNTVAVSVPNNNNYVSNDIFSHNTLITLQLDMLISMVLLQKASVGFASYDAIHIRGVLEKVIQVLENHPFFDKILEPKINRSPNFHFYLKSGYTLDSVNMNLGSKNPGGAFFQKHLDRLYGEEFSFESEEVHKKRLDAVSENGCIAEDELILLEDFSTKKIQDIKIGDVILGWNENDFTICSTKVLNTIYQGEKDVVKVSTEDNKANSWLTPDHKILRKAPGESNYRWSECIRCETTNFKVRKFPYIKNLYDYYKGLLIGLLDSDGYSQKIKLKNGAFSYQLNIYQADEVSLVEFLLDYFGIKYTKNSSLSPFSKPNKPVNYYHIKREKNDFILSIYDEIDKNRDVGFGYVGGFIIGDGWIGYNGEFHITQNIKKEFQKNTLNKVLSFLKVKYSYSLGKRGFCWYINKWEVPFSAPLCKKTDKWRDKIYFSNKKRIYPPIDIIRLKGFREKIKVYDLTTDSGNFIVGGMIVHNCIQRLSGMTNFTKYSPSGRVFTDPYKKPWVSNYPQFVNPKWDEKERDKAIREHGGESTPSFRVFVKGEVVTEGITVFDQERVRQCYLEDREIKHFEVNKENFNVFENIIILDRPSNADNVYICADVGEAAPTEIIILAEINKKYRYLYNISLFNLTDKQQYKIFKYIAGKVETNIIAIDCTEGCGRAIFRGLCEIFPQENMQWVGFNEKLDIDFERDANNRIVFKDGSPVYRQEFVADWSIIRLKILLYDRLLELPQDYKFDIQINSVVSMMSGKRTVYQCLASEDHLLSAFRVFSIAQHQYEFKIVKSLKRKKFSKSGC